MSAGYYRVDITDKITVLALDSMFWMKGNDPSYQLDEGEEEMQWFETQLATGGDRKFIITCHEYAGTRFKASQLWLPKWNDRYFAALEKYYENVIIEVVGHDHYGDLRYHELPSDPTKNFHNVLVSPGVSTIFNNNPGVASMEIDEEKFVA